MQKTMLSNVTVTAMPPGTSSAVGGSAVTNGQGDTTITVSDNSKQAVAFAVTAMVNGTAYPVTPTSTPVWVGFKNKSIGGNATSCGGGTPMTWSSDMNPHGADTDAAGESRTNSDYEVKVKSVVPSSNGWHAAFIHTFDLDQNQSGGDCTFTQFAFRVGGGTPSGSNALGPSRPAPVTPEAGTFASPPVKSRSSSTWPEVLIVLALVGLGLAFAAAAAAAVSRRGAS
jgi:hypothetical protein